MDKNTKVEGKRMLSIKEAANYVGLGLNNTRKLIEAIGAMRKVGNRVLCDRVKLDQFLDSDLAIEL